MRETVLLIAQDMLSQKTLNIIVRIFNKFANKFSASNNFGTSEAIDMLLQYFLFANLIYFPSLK